jgi:hypothetical protein
MRDLKERIQYWLYVALMSPIFFAFVMFPTKVYFDLRHRTVTNHLCSVLITIIYFIVFVIRWMILNKFKYIYTRYRR